MKLLIAVLISGIILLSLFWCIPVKRFSDIPTQIAPVGCVFGACLYFFTYVILALRWRILFNKTKARSSGPPLLSLFALAATHNFYSNILPARTGEISLVYLSKKYLGIDASEGMSSLVLVRTFDFIVLGLLATVFLILQQDNIFLAEKTILPWAVIFIFIPVLGLLSIIVWGETVAFWLEERMIDNDFKKTFYKKTMLFFIRTIRQLSKRKSCSFYTMCLGLSLILMLMRVSMLSVFLIYAVHPAPLGVAFLVSICTLVFLSLPIQGFLGLGAFEGGWVLGYAMTGLPVEDGLVTALNAHLLLLLYLGLLGAVGNTMLMRNKSAVKD